MIKTAANRSSMLQDVVSGRFPTEVGYLNGWVVGVGEERYGLDMGANRFLWEEMVELEKKGMELMKGV